jgi:hypothetical protein
VAANLLNIAIVAWLIVRDGPRTKPAPMPVAA